MTHRERSERPARPLLVSVADLRGHTGERRRLELSTCLGELGLSSAWVEPEEEVGLDLMLESMPSGLTVTGRIRAPWVGECRRCLEPVRGVVEAEVREVFSPEPTDEEIRPVVEDHLDLEPVVREAVLLELPLSPLCSEGCGGPDGRYEMAAREPSPDPRWAGLSELRFDAPDPGEG